MAYWRSYMEAMIAAQRVIMEREASHIEKPRVSSCNRYVEMV